ncbi:hypothetical protein I9W82_004712 [Candida metapsilosis]|uniref:Uncharacterized protein n=1 Tax=Candida metapsilosis TaxID=273372 RepID=A0A8H8D8W0_9ASCO|nr:hypothetical protein I9W82_004712 [Candida metapsilosis]
MTYQRPSKSKYNKKNVHFATPKKGARVSKPQKQQYRKYYHEQPSKRFAFVEEPDSEGDYSDDIEEEGFEDESTSSEESSEDDSDSDSDSSSEEDEEVYEFDLGPQDYDEEDSSDGNIEFIDASDVELESDGDEYYVDLNDQLVSAEDIGAPEVHDLNDEIVAYYDGEEASSDSSESSSDEEDADEGVEAIVHLTEEADSSADDSSDSEDEIMGYIVDTKKLEEKLLLEAIRQDFEEELVSPDEYESRDEDSELGSEPEYIEIDSSDEDESSDEEGVTIYKSLPCTECDCEDEQEDEQEEEDDDLQVVRDDDKEFSVVDLSDDVANSSDYQLEELDDGSYKLNVRFPSLVRDELKIEFLKKENELVIKGKLNFNGAETEDEEDEDEVEDITELTPAEFINYALDEDDDDEEDDEYSYADPEDVSEEEYSGDEDSAVLSGKEKAKAEKAKRDFILSQIEELEKRDGYNEDSDSDYDIDSEEEEEEGDDFEGFYEDEEPEDSEDSEEEYESDESSSEDEELQEDAEDLINQFKDQEVFFEKHFQFDKVIKFNKIKARFVGDDELELIIPSKNTTVEEDNSFAVTVDSSDDESSTTEEIDGNVPVLRDLDELLEAVEAA